jgi:hypothetical protein
VPGAQFATASWVTGARVPSNELLDVLTRTNSRVDCPRHREHLDCLGPCPRSNRTCLARARKQASSRPSGQRTVQKGCFLVANLGNRDPKQSPTKEMACKCSAECLRSTQRYALPDRPHRKRELPSCPRTPTRASPRAKLLLARLTIELRCAVGWRPVCHRKLGDRPTRHLE